MVHLRISQICLLFCAFWAFAYAQNAGDTLVLVDNLAIRETHSIFFKNLQGTTFTCVCTQSIDAGRLVQCTYTGGVTH